MEDRSLSRRAIGPAPEISGHNFQRVLDLADRRNLGWDDSAQVSEHEVYSAPFPGRGVRETVFAQPDWLRIHTESALAGATLKLPHQELSTLCPPSISRRTGITDRLRRPCRRKHGPGHPQHGLGRDGQPQLAGTYGAGRRLVRSGGFRQRYARPLPVLYNTIDGAEWHDRVRLEASNIQTASNQTPPWCKYETSTCAEVIGPGPDRSLRAAAMRMPITRSCSSLRATWTRID